MPVVVSASGDEHIISYSSIITAAYAVITHRRKAALIMIFRVTFQHADRDIVPDLAMY